MNKCLAVIPIVLGLLTTGYGADYPKDLVYFSKLDSAADVTSPSVGAAGEIVRNVTFVSGVDGNAVRIPTLGAGVVVANLPNGLPVEKGLVEFDAKIEATSSTFGAQANPGFFCACPANSNGELFSLSISGNDGAGNGGLVLVSSAGRYATHGFGVTSYSAVFGQGDYTAWHHYSCAWNTNGIAGTADSLRVSIDGKVLVRGTFPAAKLSNFATAMGQPLRMCFSRHPDDTSINKVPYCIDNFKVWKTDTPTEAPDPELPVVSEVTAKQHYPWCGKIDIGYKVAGSTDGLLVKITVKDNDNDVTYVAKTFDVTPTATVGAHTVVWDATKDGVDKVSQNMVATVALVVPED